MGNNPWVQGPYDLSPDHTVPLGVDFQQGSATARGSTPRMLRSPEDDRREPGR
jgi:hypothetical protein